MKHFFLSLVFVLSLAGHVQAGGAVKDAHTAVELITPVPSIQPGRPFWVGLRMVMDEEWHVYWRNPGDSGLPPRIEWDLPPGFAVGEIQWPYPQQLPLSGLTTYGYEGEVLLLTEIVPPPDLALDETVTLKAGINWLACKVECVPGQAELSLTLPVKDSAPVPDKELRKLFRETRNDLPRPSDHWIFRVTGRKDALEIELIPAAKEAADLKDPYFFPYRQDVIDHAAPQVLETAEDGYRLTVKKSPVIPPEVRQLEGIVVSAGGWERSENFQAVEIAVPVGEPTQAAGTAAGNSGQAGLWLAALFAFLGGLILNLMPCVLPVLALKILNLVEQAHHDKGRAWQHGLVFAFGIVFAFWVLAGLLLALKGLGAQIGWGFQFQSPGFLIFLAVLFFILAVNLFGVFEIGASLTRLGPAAKGGFKGSFFNGILATVVATPCTAPFMGTAIGFALTQNAFAALVVFTFLGLGLAFPFLILARFPQLLKWIPRPGVWMVRFKQVLGFFLMAVVIWVSWIYGLQQGIHAAAGLWMGLLLMGAGLWLWGMAASLRGKGAGRYLLIFLIVVLAAAGGALIVLTKDIFPSASPAAETRGAKGLSWESYSPELIEQLRRDGRIVFLNFTAAWCLSCQVNERVAFRSPDVIERFRQLNVAAVKADWTSHDERITRALAEFGKSSIPLYVIYFPGRDEPLVLPELLTPQVVLNAFEDFSWK